MKYPQKVGQYQQTKKTNIVDSIIGDIISGVYSPGEKLGEAQLAEKFLTSRAPVREALLELASHGFVQQIPRRGFRVTSMNKREIIDCYTIAGVLEGFALAQSLHLFYDSDYLHLEKLLDMMDANIKESKDMVLLSHIDTQFHALLSSKYDNQLMNNFSLMTQKGIAHFIYFKEWTESQPLELFCSRHRKIIDCMKEKNSVNIEKVLREHYCETGYRIAEYIDAQGRKSRHLNSINLVSQYWG